MIKIEKSVVIRCPVEDVFAFVTDIHKVPLWLPVKSIRAEAGEAVRVGATFTQTAEFMGRDFVATIEVTRYEPPRVFAFKMVKGPFPLSTIMTLTPIEEGTRLTIYGEAEPGGSLKFAGPFITTLINKQFETQASKLKSLLEA